MSKLKVVETCYTRQYVNTYLPSGKLEKVVRFVLWARTAKKEWRFKKAAVNEGLAAKMRLNIQAKGTIDTTHWEEVV